jgi:hypothetical protein
MRWVQDPNQSSVDNLNNGRPETSRHFRKKMKEYLKARRAVRKVKNVCA